LGVQKKEWGKNELRKLARKLTTNIRGGLSRDATHAWGVLAKGKCKKKNQRETTTEKNR